MIHVGNVRRWSIAGEHQLTAATLHRVKESQQLTLRLPLAGEELHVINDQQVDGFEALRKPFGFTRATFVRPTPPTELKTPPNTTWLAVNPFGGYSATERTAALEPVKPTTPRLNPPSSEPSGSSRTKPARFEPLNAVKSPPTYARLFVVTASV